MSDDRTGQRRAQIMDAVGPALREWGVHPSWCRLVASPHLYRQCEEALADLTARASLPRPHPPQAFEEAAISIRLATNSACGTAACTALP